MENTTGFKKKNIMLTDDKLFNVFIEPGIAHVNRTTSKGKIVWHDESQGVS